MLGHKTSLNKFKRLKTCKVFSQWDETKNQQQKEKWYVHTYMEMKVPTLNQWVKEYIVREIKKHLETSENENMAHTVSSGMQRKQWCDMGNQ